MNSDRRMVEMAAAWNVWMAVQSMDGSSSDACNQMQQLALIIRKED